MESFETDFNNSDYFDEIALAFSENGEEMIGIGEEHSIDEIDLNFDASSCSELIVDIEEIFEKNLMNEHIATIALLGNLGYSDMLMYYCIVNDCVFMNNESENTAAEIITPEQYVKEKETVKDKVLDFEIKVLKNDYEKLLRILNYLKNKEFRILSNTFYADGTDFIVFLSLRSVVGYNLRLNIVCKCDSLNDIDSLNVAFQKLRNNFETGDK